MSSEKFSESHAGRAAAAWEPATVLPNGSCEAVVSTRELTNIQEGVRQIRGDPLRPTLRRHLGHSVSVAALFSTLTSLQAKHQRETNR